MPLLAAPVERDSFRGVRPPRSAGPAVPRCLAPLAALAGLIAGALPGPADAAGFPSFVRELDAIPVFDATGTAEGAWNGGWQNARPQLVDYEGDGDLDLFVAEETGKLRFFRNDGTAASPDFRLVTDEFAGGVHDFFFTRMVDIDVDGDWDLLVQAPTFTIDNGGIISEHPGAFVYENVGSPAAPVWVNGSQHPDGYLVDEAGDPIPITLTSPGFTDLDGDGDPDLLLGDSSGQIILYRNVGASPSTPVFRHETDFYGGVTINPDNCFPVLPSRGRGERWSGDRSRREPPTRHGFMLFTFHDLTSAGRQDLFVGDQFNPNVYHYRNLGGSPSPALSCQTQWFFPDSNGVYGEFNEQRFVPAFGDLDGDGDHDALLGSAVDSFRGFRRYRNVGTPTAPVLSHEDDSYLAEYDGGIDSAPAFADLDGDLDPDLYLGFGTWPRISRFQNEGAPGAPVLIELYPEWLTPGSLSWLAPEFADLDADGDVDLFVGTNRGDVRWYRNDGAAPGAVEVSDGTFGVNKLIRQHVDSDAVPRFLDGDGDGDLDLVVGSFDFQTDPRLRFFRNDGSPTTPAFVLATEDFQGLGVMGQRLAPAFGDLDGDQDPDLVVGRFDGTLAFFRNISTASVPVFRPAGELPGVDVGANSVPFLVDLDADGRQDLVIGERGGGINHYRNASTTTNPSAFALVDPPPGGEVNGRWGHRFDWEPSIDPLTSEEVTSYELRFALHPTAPPEDWRVIGPLSESGADVILQVGEFRHAEDFYWTVAAGEESRSAPVPEWQHGVNTAWVDGPLVVDGTLDPHGREAPTASRERGTGLPTVFGIPRVYPVPTRDDVRVDLALPAASAVRVTVFDSTGRRVQVIYDGSLPPGTHALAWDGRTRAGRAAAPGVYLVRAESEGRTATGRVVRLR